MIARRLGVSARNDFALLDQIGGECAGAVSLLPSSAAPRPASSNAYRELDDAQLATIVDALAVRPLLAGDEGIRLSLAGAQDKLPCLEVSSSGVLHFGFTPQALFEPHESRPWNPLIASVFYRRGIIETWGQGTIRMAAWAAEAGLPKPEIFEVPGAVVVRFRAKAHQETPGKRPGKTPGKTPAAILELLKAMPELSFPEMAARLGKSPSAIERAVRKLREAGRLERVGPAKGGRWKVVE